MVSKMRVSELIIPLLIQLIYKPILSFTVAS
jgi:hypothetical protein